MLSRLQAYSRLTSSASATVALLGLFLISCLHLGALLVFIRGFLLTRVALPDASPLIPGETTLEAPRYSRAVVLIIDALRFDYMFPNQDPAQSNEFHHNVLTLPAELSKSEPHHSLMFRAIADPPTTTLQRLKALTVGTLPTFVDAGSNFAGSSIEEDNWVAQAQRNGKKIAFMGDDTWTGLFPAEDVGIEGQGTGALDKDMTWPFDSFNVEDLETVDNGVKSHLLPLLKNGSADWDIAIGHMLGLDHVGHRLGSHHPEMTRKLREADALLREIKDHIRDDDLLVLMGDHGMDTEGNHGGDTAEETQASLWFYTKSQDKPLTAVPHKNLDDGHHPLSSLWDKSEDLFEYGGQTFRSITQISFVPTFSLLLGLPIPFSNLAPVIPELFVEKKPTPSWFGSSLSEALDIPDLAGVAALNARQIHTFLTNYAPVSGSNEFASVMPRLDALYNLAKTENTAQGYLNYIEQVLQASRDVWATFNAPFMIGGLMLLVASLAVLIKTARMSSYDGALQPEGPLRLLIGRAGIFTFAAVASAGPPLFFALGQPVLLSICLPAAVASAAGFLMPTPRAPLPASPGSDSNSVDWSSGLLALIPILHAISFASNSFTFWEERTTLYFAQIPLLLLFVQAFSAPDSRLRRKIALFSLLAMACLRLASVSTVCREEQQPYCIATYNLPASFSWGKPYSPVIAALSLACAFFLPTVLSAFLNISNSEQNLAPQFIGLGLRGCLTAGSAYWGFEWLSSATDFLQKTLGGQSGFLQNSLALSVFANATLGYFVWRFFAGLNISLEQITDPATGRTSVKLIGYANVLGSTYLLFFSVCLAIVWVVTQPTGQIVLFVGSVALLSYLEALDSRKDDIQIKKRVEEIGPLADDIVPVAPHPAPSFADASTLASFGVFLFFSTGHEAVLSTIQWKAAFVGLSKVVHPWSPLLVLLNTLGPTMLVALAVPLLVFWNAPPPLKGAPARPLLRQLFRTCTMFLCYFTMLALSAAAFAAWHRRHLMVWKVFAPRFMLSGIMLLGVDGALMGAFWGGSVILQKSSRMLGSLWI